MTEIIVLIGLLMLGLFALVAILPIFLCMLLIVFFIALIYGVARIVLYPVDLFLILVKPLLRKY